MRLPEFSKVALVIPFANTLGIAEKVERVKEGLRKLHLSLGGSKKDECYRTGNISALRESITGNISAYIEKSFDRLISSNEGISKYAENEGFRQWFSVSHDYFAEEYIPPVAVVHLEIGMIFEFNLRFIKDLKENRPNIYPLIRMILQFLHYTAPAHTMEDAVNYLWEMHYDPYHEGDERNEEARHFVKLVEDEYDEYRKHIICSRGSLKKLLPKVKSLHKKVKWELSGEENWFVETAIQLMELWKSSDSEKITLLYNHWDDDRNDITSFFNLLWDPEGAYTEDKHDEYHNHYGNQMAPVEHYLVADMKTLEEVCRHMKMLLLYEVIFAGGEQIWN